MDEPHGLTASAVGRQACHTRVGRYSRGTGQSCDVTHQEKWHLRDSQSGPYTRTSVHEFKPITHEGAESEPVLLRCTADTDDTDTPPAYHDAAISHMLSVQYISQKLGLAKHILAVTSEFVDDIYDLNYFDLDITHTSDTATNTIHRTNAISHCTSQEEERHLTDRRLTDNMSGTPKCVGIPPPVTTTVSEQQYIPSWLHRRIAHTLGGDSLAPSARVVNRSTPLSHSARAVLSRGSSPRHR